MWKELILFPEQEMELKQVPVQSKTKQAERLLVQQK
jgi:hypothetical protein